MSFRPVHALAAATTVVAILALAPAASAATPGIRQVTGSKLATALVPASYFGRGFKATGPIDTGNALQPGNVDFNIAKMSCSDFWAIYGEPALGETALAEDQLNDFGAGLDDQQIVYQLPSSRVAKSFYGTAYTKYGKCREITIAGRGYRMHVKTRSIARTRVGRSTAFVVTQVSTFTDDSVPLYTYTLFALDGDDAFILEASTPSATEPDLTAIVARLISRVVALR